MKILKIIYSTINVLFALLDRCYKYIFNYYFINGRKIFFRQIIIQGKICSFNQKTYFTGLGKILIGANCKFGYKLGGFYRGGCIEFQARDESSSIIIGENVSSNNNIFICAANFVSIGKKTLIGQNVTITDHEAHGIDPDKRNQIGEIGKVEIGNNVWIGSNVLILKNSKIGDNSIVAAGAIVSGVFPDNVIIGGIPAKIIRNL